MVRKLPQCRRTSHRARLLFEAARSSPVCLPPDRSRSSSPYIPTRELKPPARYFPVCAFSLFLLTRIPLCNPLCSLSLWSTCHSKTYHRDTENTDVAQRSDECACAMLRSDVKRLRCPNYPPELR